MTVLLEAMGWTTGPMSRARLVAMIGVVALVLLVGGVLVGELLGVPLIVVQATLWLVWLVWLGAIFPRNAGRDAEVSCTLPYRRAFTREILLGIAVAFSQFLRPALVGILAQGVEGQGPELAAVAGASLAVGGAAVIAMGASALGVARTLFVFEYVSSDPKLVTGGIYKFLRHPLFLGGALLSLGLALMTRQDVAVGLAIVNLAVTPAYVRLEDRRCCTVLGRAYASYRTAVGGMVPRRCPITDSALSHQVRGSAGPSNGRSQVNTR